MMGGQIDWVALPLIAEYLEVQDFELLIDGLMVIADVRRKMDEHRS